MKRVNLNSPKLKIKLKQTASKNSKGAYPELDHTTKTPFLPIISEI